MRILLVGIITFSIVVGFIAYLASPRGAQPPLEPVVTGGVLRDGTPQQAQGSEPRFEDFAFRRPLIVPEERSFDELDPSIRAWVAGEIGDERPNFAGSAFVLTRSCGADCEEVYVLEAEEGPVRLVDRLYAHSGVLFRSGSTLLVVNSGGLSEGVDRLYYALEKDSLQLVMRKDVQGTLILPSTCEQIGVLARDEQSAEIRAYPSPCHVPYGWVMVESPAG